MFLVEKNGKKKLLLLNKSGISTIETRHPSQHYKERDGGTAYPLFNVNRNPPLEHPP